MSGYLTNITPDSLSGIIFALESISRSVVLLNGPTGCKYYHSATSDMQLKRQSEFDPLNYPLKWYFGQPRVPCTFLDSGDYIYGGMEKLTEAIEFLCENVAFDMLCIVNSPGAALIGDDLSGIARQIITDKPVITFETSGYSSDICTGFETGILELLRQLNIRPSGETAPRCVNLLGISLYQRNYAGDLAELTRILEMCGVEVNCAPGADCDIQRLHDIPKAALNIVIHPEYGTKTAEYLYRSFKTPYYVCNGAPVGFKATEEFAVSVCERLDADSSAFIEDCERARARAYSFISRVNSLTGLPKGTLFAVEGTYSEVYAYTSFLAEYFGMIPDCANILSPDCGQFRERAEKLYTGLGASKALGSDIMQTEAELVFASGNTIAGLKLRRHTFSGVEISLPTLGYFDVIPKTYIGIRGALALTESILNGLMY